MLCKLIIRKDRLVRRGGGWSLGWVGHVVNCNFYRRVGGDRCGAQAVGPNYLFKG